MEIIEIKKKALVLDDVEQSNLKEILHECFTHMPKTQAKFIDSMLKKLEELGGNI